MDEELINNIITESNYVKTVKLGYYPNILKPRTFNEHLLYMKFFDKNPLMVTTTDKVAVNDYVKNAGYAEILIPNYYITDNPTTIPFDKLPNKYIIKPNQLSGAIIVVKNNNIDRNAIIKKCNEWLKERHYGANRFIWFTADIKPMIIVQKLLSEECPVDYKFHMIHNKCAFIGVYTASSIGGHPRRNSNYDMIWNRLPFTISYSPAGNVPKPKNLGGMIDIAIKLSKPFKYVRVDLYNFGGKVYFGELSHIPGSGSGKFTPEYFDYKFGKLFNK